MAVTVFLSHNTKDKPFVRRLARDLGNHGVETWLDEAELKIGDSLIEKIRAGIDTVDYVAVVLSENSVDSPWVQRELDVAMNHEINGKPLKVLPLLLEQVELPGFLLGKFYADFTDDAFYEHEFKKLLNSIGVVYNKSVMSNTPSKKHLGTALDRADGLLIPLMVKPFHRPFQYMGLSVADAAKTVEAEPNRVGNIIVESEDCRMVLHAEGNFIHYVEVDILCTVPCNQASEFDSEPILGALSISPSELELSTTKPHFHTYYDHRKKLKINVSCLYDGAPLTVSFSSKYYGM